MKAVTQLALERRDVISVYSQTELISLKENYGMDKPKQPQQVEKGVVVL